MGIFVTDEELGIVVVGWLDGDVSRLMVKLNLIG